MKTKALSLTVIEFLNRLRSKRCLIKNIPLHNNEKLISNSNVPNLISNTYNKSEKQLINRVVYTIVYEIEEFQKIFNRSDFRKIKSFLLYIISKNKFLDEVTLHLYIFLYWKNIIWVNYDDNIIPDLKLFESECINQSINFCREVSSHITDTCDIIIVENTKKRVVLCEVKHGKLDDRAVAQIQRYFRKTKSFIDLGNYSSTILYVKPILICKDIPIKRWLTFPTYFRELLDVFTYEIDISRNELKLVNLKSTLQREVQKYYSVIDTKY